MKHSILRKLMLIAVLLTGSHTFAYDFEAQNSDGVTIYYNITSATDLTCEVTYKNDGSYSGDIVIPTSITYNSKNLKVTSIGINAFYECTGLTSITIPNSVISIDLQAFKYCLGLTSVTIPNSVTTIGDYAFSSCGLTSITIPNSVTSIGSHAFYHCTNLTSVNIPNSVTTIGGNAFNYCSGLTSITIPNSVTTIGENAFSSCGLTSITIPNSVTSIGYSAFENCTSLTSITIPNSVTSIGDRAFYKCTALSSVTLGNGLEYIYGSPFSNCNSLKTINSLPTTAPVGGEYDIAFRGFDEISYMEATLRIPKGSLASYQATDGWKEFWNIVEVENLEDVLNGTVTAYNVNANYDSTQGSVSINGTAGTYTSVNADSKIEFVITPNTGFVIDKVTVNDIDVTADVVNNKYTVAKATEDVTFAVTFKEQTFSLILKCSEAGAFERSMKYGETATYTIKPSENWLINTVTFNGTDVTNDLVNNVYTTPAITANSELSVVFVDLATSVYSVYNTSDVKVSASQQTISIKGLKDNTPVAVYSTSGQMEYSKIATDYEMNINMNKNGVYLVKVGERTFKVML